MGNNQLHEVWPNPVALERGMFVEVDTETHESRNGRRRQIPSGSERIVRPPCERKRKR
jgi:hypothetical protein